MKKFRFRLSRPTLLLLAAALLLLVACGQLPLPAGTTETPEPGIEDIFTEVPDLTETPLLLCTPPACGPDEVYFCEGECPGGCGTICVLPTPDESQPPEPGPEVTVTPITGPIAAAPTDWENLEGWLPALWRGNANPAAVRDALQQSGMQQDFNDWLAVDLDGDLLDEWVVVLYDPAQAGLPWGRAGDLWIVNGDGVVFRYYNAPSDDIFEFIAPTITAAGDLTGDDLPELITNATVCGAHTCYDNYRIIGFNGDGYVDRVERPPVGDGDAGNTIGLSYSELFLDDVDQDGLQELLVHGGAIGSAGAGVVREQTEIWGWNGAAVTLAGTQLDPTEYRHHVLYEANELLATGNLDQALMLYESAINNAGLRNDGFSHAPADVQSAISQFAAFRLVLIDLLQGQTARADGRRQWLEQNFPGTAAAQAAATLIAGWTGAAGVEALCAQIDAALVAFENPTGALVDMGYGNPSLTGADLCP